MPQSKRYCSGIAPDLDDVVGTALEGRFAGVQIRVDSCNGTVSALIGMGLVEFEQLLSLGWYRRPIFLLNFSLSMALACAKSQQEQCCEAKKYKKSYNIGDGSKEYSR